MFLLVDSSDGMLASRSIWTLSCVLVLSGLSTISTLKFLWSEQYSCFCDPDAAAPPWRVASALLVIFWWNFWVANLLRFGSLKILWAAANSSLRWVYRQANLHLGNLGMADVTVSAPVGVAVACNCYIISSFQFISRSKFSFCCSNWFDWSLISLTSSYYSE